MRAVTELFTVEGQGILVPDADVTVTKTDVEEAAVRDRSGVLHRSLLRRGVTAWEFSYRQLTGEERAYMLELLGREPVFAFTHPEGQSRCFCKSVTMDYHDAAQGLWKNLRFRVEEV